MVREITQREAEKQNLLAHHITQSWQWGQFRLQTGVPKILRLGFFDGNNLKRVYQVFFHQAPYLNRLIAYLPRTESPPPDDLSVISEICKKNRAVFLKLEPEGKIDLSFGQPILPENSLLVDLNQPVDDLLASMHEKTRYNIRLAQKSGVVVTAKTDADSLTTFINLYDATQKRQGFFAKSGNYLKTLWNVLSPTKMVHLLMAEVEGEPVAAGMFFHFNEPFSFPYGGWSATHREKMPNNLLHFEAMQYAKELGAQKYDFWSSYKNSPNPKDPWYGTYIFKKGFGGVEVHYPGAYDIVFDRPTYSLFNIANKIRFPLYKIKRLLHA